MSRRLMAILVLALVSAGAASCTTPAGTLTGGLVLIDDGDHPSSGYLQHRGRMYAVEDLMDPDYRAASDDAFVQGFDPDAALATQWAGMD